MDGWVDGWIGWLVYGCVGWWMNGWIDGWMDGLVGWHIDVLDCWWMNEWMEDVELEWVYG